MPRLSLNRVPSYRLHRQSGQAIVTLNGRDFLLGEHDTKASKSEYDRRISEWIAAGRQIPPTIAAAPDLSIAELVNRYRIHCLSYFRKPDGTVTGEVINIKAAMRHLLAMYAELPAASLSPLQLQAVRERMVHPPDGGKGWARKNVNQNVNRIRAMFKWAASRELCPASVWHGLQTVSGLKAGRSDARETAPIMPVAEEVVAATLPHLSTVVAAMVRTQRLTGARPGEVCMMTTENIDRTGPVWSFTPPTHKTQHHGRARNIMIGPQAQVVLQPFLKPLNPTAAIFSPREAMEEMRQRRHEQRRTPKGCGNTIGTNRKPKPRKEAGDVYDRTSYARAITRGCERANRWAKGGRVCTNEDVIVPKWHPNQLRHSCATEIRRKFGLEAAQKILGHASADITQVYAETDAAAARVVALAVG